VRGVEVLYATTTPVDLAAVTETHLLCKHSVELSLALPPIGAADLE
jgi:hypothetical protein